MIGEEFDITISYATTLNTIFVSLFYSSGMPLLIFFAFAALFL